MDKDQLIKKINKNKYIKDYFYIISFLLVSSFFILYVIKPSLLTALKSQQEVVELRKINQVYDANIVEIRRASDFLQETREKLNLLDQAIPKTPYAKKIIDDIKNIASEEGIQIKNLSLSSLDLKDLNQGNKLKNIEINMETIANYEKINHLILKLNNQRRLKNITNLQISKKEDVYSSAEANLILKLELFTYYL